MCDTCGCESSDQIIFTRPGQEKEGHHHNDHGHSHSHDHSHPHTHEHQKTLNVELDIMGRNNLLAQKNRGWFEAKNIFALNLVSSPGSGKTSLLEKTLTDLKQDIPFFVIEGDQQTLNDANRIQAAGAPVIQINTGNGCHLDADMTFKAVKQLNPENQAVLFIENVGNLVCPSLFDLGENKRVVIISVTEGEDKPLKYPTMFESADLCIINKTDLLPYVQFDVAKCREYAVRINRKLEFLELSVTSGEGMDGWYEWIKVNRAEATGG